MIKRLFSLIVVAMLIFGFSGMAVGGGQDIRVYTYGIYDAGSGTTIGYVADNSALTGGSQYFTWTAGGNKAKTADNRTLDLNDTAPNWRAMTWRTEISAVTSVATSGNTFYVVVESCTELNDTDCGWGGLSSSSGVSTQEIYQWFLNQESAALSATSQYAIDISSRITPAARYYRFRFVSGSSQFPGSPTGTSWASEVGPKATLTITSY